MTVLQDLLVGLGFTAFGLLLVFVGVPKTDQLNKGSSSGGAPVSGGLEAEAEEAAVL